MSIFGKPILTGVGKGSASGAIASFSDGAKGLPLRSLVANIEPVQDLHGYDNPWPAGGGANQWDEQWESGQYYGNIQTGVVAKSPDNTRIRNKNNIVLQPNTAYYYAASQAGFFYFFDSNGVWLNNSDGNGTVVQKNATFTTPSDTAYAWFFTINTASYANDIAINYPSTITTYSPYSNICPISGWSAVNVWRTGKNVWDEEWEVGSIGSDGSDVTTTSRIRSKNYIRIVPNTTYYIKWPVGVGAGRGAFYDSEKGFISYIGDFYRNQTFIVPTNAHYMRFSPPIDYGTTYNHDISINYPSTDHDYHPYSGNKYTLALGQTVYGGTLDVTNGVLTVDRAMVDLGTLNWQYVSDDVFFTSGLYGIKKPGINNYINSRYGFSAASFANMPDKTMKGNSNAGGIYVKDSAFGQNPATAKTGLSGVQLVYELATPITIPLTPQEISTLQGQNNVWADSGDVDVEYLKQTLKYIGSYIR